MLAQTPSSEADYRVENGISNQLSGVAGKEYRNRVIFIRSARQETLATLGRTDIPILDRAP